MYVNNASEVRGHIRFHRRKSNGQNLKHIICSDPAPSDEHDNLCSDLKNLVSKFNYSWATRISLK